jgi:NAD+ kinase
MDPKTPRRIGLYPNPDKPGIGELVRALTDRFEAEGAEVRMTREAAPLAGPLRIDPCPDAAALARESDCLLVLGGDGTILRAVREMGEHPVPVAGINTGTLGFLTTATVSEAPAVADALLSGSFALSHRTLVEATVARKAGGRVRIFGLNEAVVSRGAISRIINLETRIDGHFLNRFHADGLIVATPTGSTAYSLSAGGPLISPEASVFVITPICPHALANRSFVLPDSSSVEVRREDEADEVVLAVDGQQMVPIGPGDTVTVTRAPFRVPLVTLQTPTIYEVLQQKLRWHGSNV